MPKFWPGNLGPRVGACATLIGLLMVATAPATTWAYNDESPMQKWSPRFLFGSAAADRTPKSVYSTDSTFSPRFSRFDRYYGVPRGIGEVEGSLGSRNPGFYYRPVRGVKRSTCVADGETCLYRSGLAGAVIKLPCCNGSVCAYRGNGFTCIEREELIAENQEDNNVDYEESLY